MASYGPIYEFAFDSQNGADILIVISKKSYTGEVTRRPLGRAPILKRENNENIYGTSLEIYAECKVDGEYAEFYTSSADEFKVDVYKDQISIWTGFITPELYSEPDIAPPYDVQIIATDGLGELRDLTFYSNETKSVYEHIKSMLDALNATRLYGIISDLKYVSGDFVSGAAGLFNMRVNLEHEVGNNCYDVLQAILRSINASMTLYGDSWLIFRKTDFIRLAEEDWVHGAYSNGHETLYPVAEFGSMDKTNWWPIGQMSSVIEPAKKSVVFQAPNHYKRNVLSDAWVISDSTSYDNIQKAYTLSSKDSYITQHIDFGAEIGYALSLKIKAMNVGAPIYDKKGNYIDQGIGVRVKVVDEGHPIYLESLDSDRGIGSYHWVSDESTWIEGNLALPALSDRKSDAQEVEIVIPLYVSTPMSKVLATSIDVTLFNIDGTYPINVYDISLGAHEKAPGYEANVVLNNNAREEGDSVETTISDAYRLANAGYIFMSGIPMLPYQDVAIGSWQIGDGEARDYVTTMAEDYAMQSALPRMSYRGILNVPRANLPVLFLRDGTYYFPRTYSYNLYDDELEVELISVPAADVEVSSIVISEYSPSSGASSGSSGGSGSGSGSGIGGGIDLSGYAKKDEVITLADLLASMWSIDAAGNLVAAKDVIIPNLTVRGDTASGAKGTEGGVVGGLLGIKVNGTTYDNPVNGILTIPDYPTSLAWSAIEGKPTKLSQFTNDAGFITSAALNGYAKTSDLPTKSSLGLGNVENKSSATIRGEITATNVTNALGYTPLSTAGGTISGTTTDPIVVNTSATSVGARLQINKVNKAYVGYGSAVGAYLYNYDTGAYIGVDTSGSPFYHNGTIKNTLIHSGNIGSQKVAGLATPVTIWGQSFDGTGNVSGALSGVTNINGAITINSSGNVGIGTTSPSYKLDVNGVARTTGWIGNNVNISCDANGNTSGYSGEINRFGGGKLWIQARQGGLELGNSAGINFNGAVTMSNELFLGNNMGIYFKNASGTNVLAMYVSPSNVLQVGYNNVDSVAFQKPVTMSSTLNVKTIKISSTEASAHLAFSRAGFNYVSIPKGGTLAFAYDNLSQAGSTMYMSEGVVTINGNAIITGDTSSGSDIRFKDKLSDHRIALSDIAEAPLFTFKWNDREDKTEHLGSSAQYWEKVAPWLVKGEDFKTLDYSTLGVAIGISLANKTINLEDRVKILEKENKALKAEIRRIQHGS